MAAAPSQHEGPGGRRRFGDRSRERLERRVVERVAPLGPVQGHDPDVLGPGLDVDGHRPKITVVSVGPSRS